MKISAPKAITAAAIAVALMLAPAGCAALQPGTARTIPDTSSIAPPSSLAEAGITKVTVFYDRASSIPLIKPAQGQWLHKNIYNATLHVAVTFATPAAAVKYRIQTAFYTPSAKKFSTPPVALASPYCVNSRQAGVDVNWVASFNPPSEWVVVVRFQSPGSAWGPWVKVGVPSSAPAPCATAS